MDKRKKCLGVCIYTPYKNHEIKGPYCIFEAIKTEKGLQIGSWAMKGFHLSGLIQELLKYSYGKHNQSYNPQEVIVDKPQFDSNNPITHNYERIDYSKDIIVIKSLVKIGRKLSQLEKLTKDLRFETDLERFETDLEE